MKNDSNYLIKCQKRMFNSKELAIAALHKMQNRRDRKRPERVYECEVCHSWHITSRPILDDTANNRIVKNLKFKDEWERLLNPEMIKPKEEP